MQTIKTSCCIVGGGPAGVTAALLLARAGVNIVLLEKHKDFLRDFRGDTIHPSTLAILDDLGLLDKFLALPHRKITHLNFGSFGPKIDFTVLPERTGFVAMVPQWDFLNFLVEEASKYPTFQLFMNADAQSLLLSEEGKVTGVKVSLPEDKLLLIHSDVVIAADGRHSKIRELSGLQVEEFGAPVDVLWFRVSRNQTDPNGINSGSAAGIFVFLIDRGDYYQCGWLLPKGGG